MGLDIRVEVNNPDQVRPPEYYQAANHYLKQHGLSRGFCHLMGRRHVIDHLPELDQVARIAGVNVAPLYAMETYPDEEETEGRLAQAESKAEEIRLREADEAAKAQLQGNLPLVLQTVSALLDNLAKVEKLSAQLLPTDFDALPNAVYFSDFTREEGSGYVGNNFGQDLLNFQRFLEFAQARGTETVWFTYG